MVAHSRPSRSSGIRRGVQTGDGDADGDRPVPAPLPRLRVQHSRQQLELTGVEEVPGEDPLRWIVPHLGGRPPVPGQVRERLADGRPPGTDHRRVERRQQVVDPGLDPELPEQVFPWERLPVPAVLQHAQQRVDVPGRGAGGAPEPEPRVPSQVGDHRPGEPALVRAHADPAAHRQEDVRRRRNRRCRRLGSWRRVGAERRGLGADGPGEEGQEKEQAEAPGETGA